MKKSENSFLYIKNKYLSSLIDYIIFTNIILIFSRIYLFSLIDVKDIIFPAINLISFIGQLR